MNSDEDTEVRASVAEQDDQPADEPSWWHRDHPTFTALSGFFSGLVFVLLVPAMFVGILSLMLSNNRVQELFPLVLVMLVVPLFLTLSHKTRRYGIYMWIGIVTTAIVVAGVSALVLYVLVNGES